MASDPKRDDDDFDDIENGGPGCVHCQYEGWHHGCCDDMCIGSNEPQWCDDARPCRHCNKHMEIW